MRTTVAEIEGRPDWISRRTNNSMTAYMSYRLLLPKSRGGQFGYVEGQDLYCDSLQDLQTTVV